MAGKGCWYRGQDPESRRRFAEGMRAQRERRPVVEKLANGAWRWSDDPPGEYRDPPGPPLGTPREENS